ncbi:MAG: IS481 family transposase [Chromatiaceae bacterium]|nr:IS481 family transposase [Chromatiaceae bacterium]
MNLNLHKNARTTPAIRQELRESTKSERELAREYHLNRATVRKWRQRETGEDASHRPHHLHATLTPAQERVVVELRTTLFLSLDDLLAVTREFLNPAVSRSGMDRCLRRHGVSNLQALIPQPEDEEQPKKTFKDDVPGFIHADIKALPPLPDETAHRYLCVAIDRASRWIYVEIWGEKTANNAAEFLQRLAATAPFKVQKVLTDNDNAFTDRCCAAGERDPTGRHRFDRTCDTHGIDHRLIKPRHPQANGMVERFNGRISEVLATTHFDAAANLEEALTRYVRFYNYQIQQKALGHLSPVQALKDWQEKRPELFKK